MHADIASHEVELLDLTASSSSTAAKAVKYTCSGKVQEHTIPNLLPGTRYQASSQSHPAYPAVCMLLCDVRYVNA